MLADQILKTLKYFDVQDHPLTLLEIQKYLLREGDYAGLGAERQKTKFVSAGEIQECLQEQLMAEVQGPAKVQSFLGFYFLAGRQEIAELRWQNNLYAVPRLKRAKKYLKYIRHIPFISAVAMAGSEALNNSRQGSDIDLLVLTQPNRIWLGRLLLTFYFQIFGVRRYGEKVANRFCLNHYIQEGKTVSHERHVYTAVEYVSLIPFFGGDKIYQFQNNNLQWIREYLAQPFVIEHQTKKASWFKKLFQALFANSLGDLMEKAVGKYQAHRIHIGDSIVVQEDELSFHPGNKARQVQSRYELRG